MKTIHDIRDTAIDEPFRGYSAK